MKKKLKNLLIKKFLAQYIIENLKTKVGWIILKDCELKTYLSNIWLRKKTNILKTFEIFLQQYSSRVEIWKTKNLTKYR